MAVGSDPPNVVLAVSTFWLAQLAGRSFDLAAFFSLSDTSAVILTWRCGKFL